MLQLESRRDETLRRGELPFFLELSSAGMDL